MTTSVPTPTVEIVTVTPELAAKWLKQNTSNRRIRERAVTDYARDMRSGAWLMNGEAIKFAADGLLLDGQHRLLACVEAGVAVPMLVVTGLPTATQETMDAGSRRSVGDALGLRGESYSPVLASVLKRVWMWDLGDHRFRGRQTPTVAECSALLAERPEILRSVEIAVRTHQVFRYMPMSITGTAHHVLSRIDGREAVWFFARLANGADLAEGHPILTLRNRILSDRADGRRLPDHRSMAYVIRTWNAVRDGRELGRIIQAPDAPMPMPK